MIVCDECENQIFNDMDHIVFPNTDNHECMTCFRAKEVVEEGKGNDD